METGTGRTTLLFSHFSTDHMVFTKDDGNTTDSLAMVKSSPHLHSEVVTFTLGPTQETLPQTALGPRDAAMIDGPHAYPFPELEYYYIYPNLTTGALLVVDDIHIPTIENLFNVLKCDAMFDLLGIATRTAFFARTDAPTFDPLGDDWASQSYNASRFPIAHGPRQWLDYHMMSIRQQTPDWVKKVIPESLRAAARDSHLSD
jgi:hypothetical protein